MWSIRCTQGRSELYTVACVQLPHYKTLLPSYARMILEVVPIVHTPYYCDYFHFHSYKHEDVMKPTIEKIKVVFVSKMSEQVSSDIFGGRKSKMCPIGHVHIFEIEGVEGIETLAGFSFCGKERSLVGEVTKVV